MKASFNIPVVIGIQDYHQIEDLRDIFIDLGIEDIKIDEKEVDGGYYAIIYKKGHKLSHKKIIKMINKYEDEGI
jgi:hypothetical protein